MKDVAEIQDRIRQLLIAELNARVEVAQKRLPHMCTHNYRHPLDVRKRVEDEINEDYNRITKGPHLPVVQTMGLCMLNATSPEEWTGTICEDPIDAQQCPYFNPKVDKKAVWALFHEQISDPEWLRANMPEVCGLLWALDMSTLPAVPWWKRLWYSLMRIRVEPLRPVEDPANLLPPAS